MSYTLGIDIGATKTIFVLMRGQRALETRKVLTPKSKSKLITMLKRNILELGYGRKIKGIGIGVPGPLNEKRDLILNPPNLRCLRSCPLAKLIEKDLKIKTKMENDADCFALGEAALGAGRTAKIVLGITLGSGVGGGLILRSRANKLKPKIFIYLGAFGSAVEAGHMTLKFDGPKCSCGSYGCFEEYCSEKFFIRKGSKPIEFQKKAGRGDKKALALYNEYGKYLGIGLASLINLFDPEVIVIGGGIANGYKFFIKEARKEIKKRVISRVSGKCVKIKRAELGALSGAIGATMLNPVRG